MMKYLFTAVLFFAGSLGFSGDVSAASISKPVSNLGLVGYWSFDEGTSTVAHDFSGNGNNGTLTNMDSTTDWVAGKRGKALDFDGSNDHVPVGTSSTLDITGSLTVSTWVKFSSLSAQTIASKWGLDNNANYSWLLFANHFGSGRLDFLVSGNGTGYVSVSTGTNFLKTGQWYHIVAVYNTTSISLYVDGVLIGTNSTSIPGSLKVVTVPVTIGADYDRSDNVEAYRRVFNGQIDDVRIHSRALLPTEITALYRGGQATRKGVSNDGLVGHWSFNEGTSTIAHDFSGSGNNGTLTNMDSTTDWVAGKRGKALDFDGSNDHVYGTIPASTFSGDWTVTAWFNHRAMSAWGAIFSNSVGTTDTFLMTMRNTTTQFGINRVGVSETGVYVDLGADHYNKWIFGIIKKEGSTITVTAYEDGIPNTSTGTLSWTLNTDNEFYIGRHYASESQIFNGQIDDVRVYARSLSTAEIDELYKTSEAKINASQDTKMTNGLVGMWSFNGKDMNWTANLAYDRSGNNNNGTITNMSTTTSPVGGKVGQALLFDGLNDYVQSNTSLFDRTNGQELSVSVWIKPARLSGQYQGIVNNRSSGGFNWHVYHHTTDGSVQLHGSSQNKSTYIPALDRWTHITATVDSAGNYLLYANGVLVQTVAGYTYQGNSPSQLNIGATYPGSEQYAGSIDEVRIYNRALSAAEVKQLYLLGK